MISDRFSWSEDVKTVDIYRRMTLQDGDNCVSQRMVYKWMETFKAGRTTVPYDTTSD
jgi:hypothetical protein